MNNTDLHTIARHFFERICQVEAPSADCLLFDTTNYTYMVIDKGILSASLPILPVQEIVESSGAMDS